MDRFLSSQRVGGAFQSEGAFRIQLDEARRKLSEFGQLTPFHWTLLLAQALCLLDCKGVEVRVSSRCWMLEIHEFASCPFSSSPDRDSLVLSLERCQTPADFILLSLCGLSGLGVVEAYWQDDATRLRIYGETPGQDVSEFLARPGILIIFETKAPAFPRALWRKRLAFSPLSFDFGPLTLREKLSRNSLLETHEIHEPHWLEYLLDFNDSQRFQITSSGVADVERNPQGQEKILRWNLRRERVRVRLWADPDSGLPKETMVIFARNGLFGSTLFHPVKNGCLLEPFYHRDFPEGFEIYFCADSLGTDISQLVLLHGDEISTRLAEITPAVEKAVDEMFETIRSTLRMERPKRTPFIADLAPNSLGVLSLSVLWLMGGNPTGFFLSSLLAAPVAGYYWVSRRCRRREFEEVRDLTLTMLENKRAALRAFRMKYRVEALQSVD